MDEEVDKLKTATKRTPVKPVVLLEQLIMIISAYPLEHVQGGNVDKQVDALKVSKDFMPEIIISESFSI